MRRNEHNWIFQVSRILRHLTFRWISAFVFVTLLAAFAANVQGVWVNASTFVSGALSGTVAVPPVGVTCGDGAQQFGFLDVSGNPLDSINLDDPGDSLHIQVCVDGQTIGGADTVQVVIEHDDSIVELSNPACVGLLDGGFVSPSTKRTSDDQASAFICSKPGGMSGTDGAVIQFAVNRIGFGEDTLSFRTAGTLATGLYESGLEVPVVGFDSITVR